jgi:two-component system, sensor histidine kinase and response regulator
VFGSTIRAAHALAAALEQHRPPCRVIGLRAKGEKAPADPYRILVVDDHEENRSLLRMLLEQVGFWVKTAENGRQAIALHESWRPHLIWMDMRMPVMDGFEATRIIRKAKADPSTERAVIIALTASAFKEDRAAVLAAGCDDFVRRPFLESEIWDKMKQHLRVDFIYEALESPDQKPPGDVDDHAITEGIKALPEQERSQLAHAIEEIDFDATIAILRRIETDHGELARYLAKMVNAYQFDTLQKLFEKGSGPVSG